MNFKIFLSSTPLDRKRPWHPLKQGDRQREAARWWIWWQGDAISFRFQSMRSGGEEVSFST